MKAGASEQEELRRTPAPSGSGAGSDRPRRGCGPPRSPCQRRRDNHESKLSRDTRFTFERMGADPRAALSAMSRAVVIVIAWLFSHSVSADPQTLTIVYPPEKNAFHDAAAAIIREAYKRLDIEIVFKILPGERALQSSNRGMVDGELVRIAGIDERYPNLIRVPVSHVMAEQMAFGRDATIVIDGWQSLVPYKFAFHRGYKIAEKNTEGMNRHLTSTDDAAFRMVAAGRMDLALANRFTGEKIIHDLRLDNVVMIKPPVQVDLLFHYLHKMHAGLVPQITAVLRRMEVDGAIDAIRSRYGIPLLGD